MPFSLFLALKYLKPKRSFISAVTVISIIGVMLGVAILVIVQAVMTGFDRMWVEKILNFRPHISVYSMNSCIENEEDVCKKLEKIPGVKGVSPVIATRVLIRNGDRVAAPILIGIDPDRAESVSQVSKYMRRGKFDIDGEKLLVGLDLASDCGMMIGSKVLVYSPRTVMSENEMYLPEEVKVSGIYDLGMQKFDAGFVMTSLGVARELVGLEKGVQSISIVTDDASRFAEYAQKISGVLGDDYRVVTWREEDSVFYEALQNEKAIMFVLLVFITIVAIFCVANTLIVVTVQKTNEIGLLKALGFTELKIMAVFLWHGMIQCIIGVAIGIGAAFLVLFNLEGIVNQLARIKINVFPKDIYGLDKIPWDITGEQISVIVGIVFVFCMLASLYPALRAARMNPVEALRHE